MVLVYKQDTNDIVYTENGVMLPSIPMGSLGEKVAALAQEGLGFVCVPYEMGVEVLEYKVCFENGLFTGIQPK